MQTRDGVWLSYRDEGERDQRMGPDAQTIGDALALEHVVLLGVDVAASTVTLRIRVMSPLVGEDQPEVAELIRQR